jgi:transcriptional regulator with XRE-family HTH domain
MSPLSIRVRELRDARGWTQQQLADAAGVRIATISRLENHHPTSIDLRVLDKLASALKVEPGFLIVREPVPRRTPSAGR